MKIEKNTITRLKNLKKYGEKVFNNFNLDIAINKLIDYYKFADC